MTKINKLLLSGFKSFGEKTELIFGDGFNCILGPNGSGKSNVFDAICFVLGKGSAKGLRAEKSANLIYNGGKSKTPAKQGEVSIFFDNSDGTFPTEEKEVKITRIVKPSGQSVYKINDKTRTREEILELLSIAKINPDGYNIVLQGDIVRFIEMSPTDKRLMIDKISGISSYEEKKQKALHELEKFDEKLSEVEIILNERKNSLEQLEKERKQALKFKELEGKIKQNKATILYREIEEKKKEQEEANSKIENHKNRISAIKEEISKLKEKIEKKKKEIDEINKNIEERGEKEQVKIHNEVENLRVEIATKESKIDGLKKEIEKIENRKGELEKNIEELESKISEYEKEITSFNERRKEKEKELENTEKKIDELKKKFNLENISEQEEEMDKIEKDIEKKQEEITRLRGEQQEILREKDKLEVQISSIDDKIKKLSEIEKEHKKELEVLKKKRQEFKKVTLELTKALNDDSSSAAQLKNARQKVIDLRDKISEIKAKNASLNEKISTNISIQKIMENKNRFGGTVYGPVYELGNVKSKYSLALETAAGARIKSIVVDNDKTAAECIKYLKANKLGVATFIPMNKIKAPEMSSVKANGVVGRAIDLIDYDKKFSKVFSYVFGDTIVVDNIDAARRIGIGKIRMVTLTGDLVESSGAMQGGYRKKQPYSFKEKEVVEELKKYEKELEDYQSVILNLESKRDELEKKIENLREFKANLEGEIIKMEKSLHVEPEELELNEKMKEELKKKLEEVDKKEVEISMKISSINNEFTKLRMEKQKIKDKISELRDPSKLAQINTFQERRNELIKIIGEIDNNINNLNMQLENVLIKEKENVLKIMKQDENELGQFSKEMEILLKDIEDKKKELKEKEEKEKEFYEQFKTLFKKRNELSDEVQKLEIEVIAKEEKMRDYEQKITSIELTLTKWATELNMLESEYEEYKDVELSEKDTPVLKREITEFEKMVVEIGDVNLKAIEMYDDLKKEYDGLIEKKEKLISEREDVLMLMNEIETKKKDVFMNTFNIINENFKKMFSQLSQKGDAYLELENPNDPLNGGINVKVKIGTAKFLDLRSLSGGEKTLTALAFIFAVQEYEPASFYVLDEVDAALDKRNAEKLGELIKAYSKRAQYVVVSHNDGVIAEADYLFGVSMREDGISKVVSLKI